MEHADGAAPKAWVCHPRRRDVTARGVAGERLDAVGSADVGAVDRPGRLGDLGPSRLVVFDGIRSPGHDGHEDRRHVDLRTADSVEGEHCGRGELQRLQKAKRSYLALRDVRFLRRHVNPDVPAENELPAGAADLDGHEVHRRRHASGERHRREHTPARGALDPPEGIGRRG